MQERLTKNRVLHKTGTAFFVILNVTLQVKTICANYCSKIK